MFVPSITPAALVVVLVVVVDEKNNDIVDHISFVCGNTDLLLGKEHSNAIKY